MKKEKKEVFAVNKKTGDIRKFESITLCAKRLDSTSSGVLSALRLRGSVKGWKIVTIENLEADIEEMQNLLNTLKTI